MDLHPRYLLFFFISLPAQPVINDQMTSHLMQKPNIAYIEAT